MLNSNLKNQKVSLIGEEISHELGEELVKNFRQQYPDEIESLTVGKSILLRILSQPTCEGIKFHHAINEKGERTLVYLGVDAECQEILKFLFLDTDGVLKSKPAIVADRLWPSPKPSMRPGVTSDDWNWTID